MSTMCECIYEFEIVSSFLEKKIPVLLCKQPLRKREYDVVSGTTGNWWDGQTRRTEARGTAKAGNDWNSGLEPLLLASLSHNLDFETLPKPTRRTLTPGDSAF